jgi:hypothetical protein
MGRFTRAGRVETDVVVDRTSGVRAGGIKSGTRFHSRKLAAEQQASRGQKAGRKQVPELEHLPPGGTLGGRKCSQREQVLPLNTFKFYRCQCVRILTVVTNKVMECNR